MKVGESFEESIANYEYFLGEAAGLKPGMKVLDLGCGVGGPQRALARKFGASIVGLNISEYQIGKCSAYNSKAGLDHLCSVLHGDFLNIPAEGESFDAAYRIEAMPHAPDKAAVYAEIFRVLRPGAVFVGYDWCMTPLYDSGNPEHREYKEAIEYSNAAAEITSFTEVADGLRAVGFEFVEAHDRAHEADPRTPWYRPLESNSLKLRSLPRTALGRKITSAALRVLEGLRAVPRGSSEVQKILNIAADSLVAARGVWGFLRPCTTTRRANRVDPKVIGSGCKPDAGRRRPCRQAVGCGPIRLAAVLPLLRHVPIGIERHLAGLLRNRGEIRRSDRRPVSPHTQT